MTGVVSNVAFDHVGVIVHGIFNASFPCTNTSSYEVGKQVFFLFFVFCFVFILFVFVCEIKSMHSPFPSFSPFSSNPPSSLFFLYLKRLPSKSMKSKE